MWGAAAEMRWQSLTDSTVVRSALTMDKGADQPKAKSVSLYEQRGETSRFIDASINEDGDLVVSGQDVGKAPREFWGDADYKYWAHARSEQSRAGRSPARQTAHPARRQGKLSSQVGGGDEWSATKQDEAGLRDCTVFPRFAGALDPTRKREEQP